MSECPACGMRDDDWFLCRRDPCSVKMPADVGEERIIAAAIRQYGLTISLPPPARHHHLLHPMNLETGVITLPQDQGFLTSKGRFVGRFEAKDIARHAGQLLPRASKLPELFSEDVW